MENIQIKLVILLFIVFSFPHFGLSQDSLKNELDYEVNIVYPPASISKEKLIEARSLSDLNKWFEPSWVRAYISVEVMVNHK